MEFDFHKRYQELSDAELMNICHNPEKFQPRAVEAAHQVLRERAVEVIAPPEEASNTQAAGKLDLLKKLGRFFEDPKHLSWDFDKEGEQVAYPKPAAYVLKWYWALLISLGLTTLYGLYTVVRLTWSYMQYDMGILNDWTILILWIGLLIDLMILYGLYKRKSWSWYVLLFIEIQFLSTKVIGFFTLYTTPYAREELSYSSLFTMIFFTLYHLGVTILLNQAFMMDIMGIGKKQREKAWLISLGIIIVLHFVFYLYK